MGSSQARLHAIMRACRRFDDRSDSPDAGMNPERAAAIMWRFFQNGQSVQDFASSQ
jgi:hypothetical protein